MRKICYLFCTGMLATTFAVANTQVLSDESVNSSTQADLTAATSANVAATETSCSTDAVCAAPISSSEDNNQTTTDIAASRADQADTAPEIVQNSFTTMPEVNIVPVEGGEQKIEVVSQRSDGSKQIYVVKVDRRGNKETLVIIEQPDGSKITNVVTQGDQQVQVGSQPKVIISEDGILVNATEPNATKNLDQSIALPDDDRVED